MTTVFYKAVIIQGEIWCWSLLGPKGLSDQAVTESDDRLKTLYHSLLKLKYSLSIKTTKLRGLN